MALYYVLLRGWVVFGHSEIALRSLSVVIAVGALWVVILLARSLFGRRVALLAGLLLAVNPLYVQFAQDVRGYSLALLLVSASCFFFVRAIRQVDPPPRWCWTAYTLVTALAAYSNFWAALVPVGQALSLAFLPAGTHPVAPGPAVGRRTGRAPGPARTADRGHGQRRRELGRGVLGRTPVHAHPFDRPPRCPRRAGARGCDLRRGRRRPRAPATARSPMSSPASGRCSSRACWLVVPVAAVVLLSLVDKPLLVVRYLMVSLPAAILLVGTGDRPHGIARPTRAPPPSRRWRWCWSSGHRPSASRSGTPRAGPRTSGRPSATSQAGPSRATAC